MRFPPARNLAALAFPVVFALLTGCSTSFAPGPVDPVETAFGNIAGQVYGGQQAIVGAAVTAYQTSTSGYGAASTSLAASTTDSAGYFSFPASTTCTSGRVVYLYSLGGNPGSGMNSAAGLMAVLGTCPASGLLINAITTGTKAQIFMNEVSTVAAAYALAGFASTATAIGNAAASENTTAAALANVDIQNAAANAAQMYDTIATDSGGIGATRAARTTTPNGNGTVPQTTLDTLANILAACVNSTGPTSAACSSSSSTKGLLYYATSTGTTAGTLATNTATAAIYIAQHPGLNVTALYNLVGSSTNPFTPALTAVPNDFSIGIVFTGSLLQPVYIAIDATGNAWVSNLNTNVSKLSPLGVPASGSPFTGNNTIDEPAGVAIDQGGNAWVANLDSVTELNSSGGYLHNYTTDLDSPDTIAIDGSDDVWVDNFSTGTLTRLNNSNGSVLSYTTLSANATYGQSYENYQVAIDHSENVWVAEEQGFGGTNSSGTNLSGTPFLTSDGSGNGLVIDSGNYIWTSEGNGGLRKVSSTGTVSVTNAATAPISPQFFAIDGAGSIWLGGNGNVGGSIAAGNLVFGLFEVNNAGALVSPGTTGYTASGKLLASGSVAVDGSGDVWYANTYTDNTSGTQVAGTSVVELIGIATPVVTPISPNFPGLTTSTGQGVKP